MTLGTILLLAYWGFWTVQAGFKTRHARKTKELQHETKLAAGSENEARIKKAARLTSLMRFCGGVLRVVGWVETALLIFIAIWLVYLIGAVIAGSFILFGYPV